MQYLDFINHLYNLKILSFTFKQSISTKVFFKQAEDNFNEIQIAEWAQDNHFKTESSIENDFIEDSNKTFLSEFEEEVKNKIIELLTNTDVENLIEFINNPNQISELLFAPESTNLEEYIFNKSKIKTVGNQEIVNTYLHLLETDFNSDFMGHLSLIEDLKQTFFDSISFTNNELSKVLKSKNKSDTKEYVKQLYTSYQNRINQSHYIFVSSTLKNEYLNLASLSQIVFSIVKTNSLNTQTFNEQKDKITSYLNDLFFIAYLEDNFLKEVENINLNDEEVLNLIQNRNKLNSEIYPDYIDHFKEIEKQLINEDYFNKKGIWSKGKEDLIGFIIECSTKGYFKIKLDGSYKLEIRNFFEERYLLSIQKQFQPNQRVKLKAKSTQFNWINKAM